MVTSPSSHPRAAPRQAKSGFPPRFSILASVRRALRRAVPTNPMADLERAYPSLRARLIGMLGIFAALFLGLAVYLYAASRSLFAEALERELSGDLEWLAGS